MDGSDGQEKFSLRQVEDAVNVWGFPDGPWHLGEVWGYPVDLNPRTIVFTWVAMGVVLLLGWSAARGADLRRPGRAAALFELIWDFVAAQIGSTVDDGRGRGTRNLVGLMVAFLLFIAVANLLGLVPTMVAPTADLQTAAALALVTFILVQVYGVGRHGAGYFRHLLRPFPLFLPLNLIEELARPLTLAFRLFGNMQGKEVMIFALLGLITGTAEIAGGFLASVVWLAFGAFISLIQAFIFMMLSIAYVAMATEE